MVDLQEVAERALDDERQLRALVASSLEEALGTGVEVTDVWRRPKADEHDELVVDYRLPEFEDAAAEAFAAIDADAAGSVAIAVGGEQR